MDKNIDKEWKDAVEKERLKEPGAEKENRAFEADFRTFISSMAMEALIFLGEISNPITKKKEESLDQARYVIDTLTLLKNKTKGNLTAEEANAFDSILYELRTKFISKGKPR
ncbi:MAG: DUF1844 domain-containing protein [Candidatus Omnitrophica bacterium]|nr:DUF1844 domain-containing protein [Candidatus Omnitrophota bacterium]